MKRLMYNQFKIPLSGDENHEYDDNVLVNAFTRIINIRRLGNYSQAIRMLVSAVLCHIEVFPSKFEAILMSYRLIVILRERIPE